MVWADGSDVTTLDGAFVMGLQGDSIPELIQDRLVRYKPDMSVESGLAESWSIADDKLTWTFKLRKDVKFSNGNPADAAAVKFSLERIMDEKTGALSRLILAAVDRVEAGDPSTEWATYVTKWSVPERTRWLIGRMAGNPDTMLTRLFSSSEWDRGSNNNTRFSSPRVDELPAKGRSTFDVKERAAYYKEIQEITWKYLPALYMHNQQLVVAHRANVTGVDSLPAEVLLLGWLDKK